MSRRTDTDLLGDIREAAQRISRYTAGTTYEKFLSDAKTQDAVIRNLEIIGEATKNLTAEMRARNPGLPWKGMAAMRDRLIHDYFGVNLDIVWRIVADELPEVKEQIDAILGKD